MLNLFATGLLILRFDMVRFRSVVMGSRRRERDDCNGNEGGRYGLNYFAQRHECKWKPLRMPVSNSLGLDYFDNVANNCTENNSIRKSSSRDILNIHIRVSVFVAR